MAYEVGGVTCTPAHVRALEEPSRSAHASTASRAAKASAASSSLERRLSVSVRAFEQAASAAKPAHAGSSARDEARPQLTRWGCSTKLLVVWTCLAL